jgi:hypothetical protein
LYLLFYVIGNLGDDVVVQTEIRDGVTWITCKCYDCTYIPGLTASGYNPEGIEYTVLEFRQHQTERRDAYHLYLQNKIRTEEPKASHTKETEALAGHGRPASVPTFFDLGTGQLSQLDHLPGIARWETLWRASDKSA